MITLTGMNNKKFLLNSAMIYRIDQAPDTIITLSDGKTLMVKESLEVVAEKVLEFHQKVMTKEFFYETK